MSAKHIPGPWKITEDRYYFYIGNSDIDIFVEIPKGEAIEEQKANATLIAAAPDLLDTCVMAFNDLWRLHGNGFGTEYEKVIATLEMVISTAEGK